MNAVSKGLIHPAGPVEAGERLVPSRDLLAEVDPYLRRLYRRPAQSAGATAPTGMLEEGVIEVAPLPTAWDAKPWLDEFVIVMSTEHARGLPRCAWCSPAWGRTRGMVADQSIPSQG